jgi:hypothetical protein
MTCCAVYFHDVKTEPEFVNVLGYQETIPRNRFRQHL